jgi:hypothetical protein
MSSAQCHWAMVALENRKINSNEIRVEFLVICKGLKGDAKNRKRCE